MLIADAPRESKKVSEWIAAHALADDQIDCRAAESQAETARASYAQQQRLRMQDENALALLLGAPVPPGGKKGLQALAPMQSLPAGLPSDLLIERPDIRAAEQQLIAANANIGAARAAFFPRVSLTSSIGVVSNEFSRLFSNGTGAWSFAPQITLPIFDMGRNQAALDAAKTQREMAVAQYEKAIQTAFREVADALAGRATYDDQLRALNAQARAEETRYRLSDMRYRNGIASGLDLLDAQRSLYAVQLAAAQARQARLQNQVALYRTLGNGQ
jgi:multidrug efflux system outer membrane protein